MTPIPAARKAPLGKIILITSPKGGTGKTALARCVSVAASRQGLATLGIDFDRQRTLATWHGRRVANIAKMGARYEEFRNIPSFEVDSVRLNNWRDAIDKARDYDVTVIDTPPTIEDHVASIQGLAKSADLVMIPTGYTDDDLDATIPFMRTMVEQAVRACFFLNRINTRTKAFDMAQIRLVKYGSLCPIKIPLLEDIHKHVGTGFTVLDYKGAKGEDIMQAVWDFVRREAGL